MFRRIHPSATTDGHGFRYQDLWRDTIHRLRPVHLWSAGRRSWCRVPRQIAQRGSPRQKRTIGQARVLALDKPTPTHEPNATHFAIPLRGLDYLEAIREI